MNSKINTEMNGFKKRTARKMQKILDISYVAVYRGEFEKLSVDEIAARAAVSKVSIYKYFETRQGLEVELVKEILKREAHRISEVLNGTQGFKARIVQYMAVKREVITSGVLSFCQKRIDNSAELECLYREYQQRALKNVSTLFSEGKQKGIIDPELTDEALLTWVQMMIDFYQNHTEFVSRMETDEKYYQEITEIFWRGISCVQKNSD